jgi:hypothetical protein
MFVVCSLGLGVVAAVPALRAQRPLTVQPSSRTAIQQKIDPQLQKEISRRRADARHAQRGATGVVVDRHGRTLVDVRAQVDPPLKRKIAALGGRVVSASGDDQTVVVLMPVATIDRLAIDNRVRSIDAYAPAR